MCRGLARCTVCSLPAAGLTRPLTMPLTGPTASAQSPSSDRSTTSSVVSAVPRLASASPPDIAMDWVGEYSRELASGSGTKTNLLSFAASVPMSVARAPICT